MADMFDKEELGIVSSLFGMSPAMQNKAMQQAAYKRGTEAGQNLLGGVLGNVGMFSEAAGQGIRGGLGVQTPEERMMGLRQQAQQQFDTNTPEGLLQMADYLNSQGDAAGARQAVMLAQGQQGRTQGIATSRAQQIRAEREPGQVNFQQLLSSGKYTPASIAKFQQSQNPADLVLVKEVGAGGVAKPLPASLQKSEDKDLEAYDSYSSQKEALMPSIVNLTPDAEGIRKLELGPLKNAKYAAQNAAGNSTPESRAYEALRSAVGTAVNLQVSAEKGVQTDKDVLRFADALIASYGKNDTEATLQALQRYYDAINRAQQKAASRVESRRKSQNVEPYFQGQTTQQATPAPTAPTTQPQSPKTIQFKDLPQSQQVPK
jgi:hypothetical protein